MGFVVEDTFQITGRGLVIAIQGRVERPLGYALRARITRPDGTTVEGRAFREIIRRVEPEKHEREGFLIAGLAKDAVPIGSEVEFEAIPDWTPRT